MCSTVRTWWKMRHIKTETKMKPNRRFLAGTMELSNGWWRIKLLRRKNLTLAERAGDLFPLYPWNSLSFSITTYSFTLFSEGTLHLLALTKTWMFREDPLSFVGLSSGRFSAPHISHLVGLEMEFMSFLILTATCKLFAFPVATNYSLSCNHSSSLPIDLLLLLFTLLLSSLFQNPLRCSF